LGVEVEGTNHLWRQRFPKGEPEQITSGLTEEEGIAIAPDGRSLITSVGMRQTAVWVRDSQSERALSSEGYVPISVQAGLFGTRPAFSSDGKALYYLRRTPPETALQLWRTDLASGSSENMAPGFSILEFDVTTDGREVVFSTQPPGKATQIWTAALDRSSPPQMIVSSGENSPRLGSPYRIPGSLCSALVCPLAVVTNSSNGRAGAVAFRPKRSVSIPNVKHLECSLGAVERRGTVHGPDEARHRVNVRKGRLHSGIAGNDPNHALLRQPFGTGHRLHVA
jgi:hypothetical protein